MSRIGLQPIQIPSGVEVKVDDNNEVHVKGPKGEISRIIVPSINVEVNDGQVVLSRKSEVKKVRALHGLSRALVNNMVVGVAEGYSITLEFFGVGYRAEAKGQILEMSVGYSHDIHFEVPDEVKVESKTERRKNPKVTLTSHDKELLGEVAAKIRAIRPPEPYKAKGIRYVDEWIRRKAGKAGNV